MASIKIGCCGFPVAKKKYFEQFTVVEIQRTFYQPPDVSLAHKWKQESPEGFEYTMKAWQLITHEPKSPTYRKLKSAITKSKEKNYGSFKPTDEVLAAWEKTKEIADALDARIIVFQCPSSFGPDEGNKKNIKKFFSQTKRGKYILAWEPRGKWQEKDIEPICRDLDIVHVVDPFFSHQTFGKLAYYRLHGKGGYRYKYTRDDLERLKGFAQDEKDCYVMFNNVYMYEDAVLFKKMTI